MGLLSQKEVQKLQFGQSKNDLALIRRRFGGFGGFGGFTGREAQLNSRDTGATIRRSF